MMSNVSRRDAACRIRSASSPRPRRGARTGGEAQGHGDLAMERRQRRAGDHHARQGFEQQGGIWEHNPVPGFTTEMMNKLRAQIIAGDPPAASQLKGPEIAAWSKIGAVVDLDAQVKDAGYEAVVPAELARLSKPYGHWIALPIQAYRINTLFMSKKAADRVGVTQVARHLVRVQCHRRQDEGGRHHPGRERRHQMG